MEKIELNPDEIYHIISPFLNETQDKLYYLLSHGYFEGKFWEICKHLNITEEEGESIIEEIKEIQYKNFPEIG